MIDPGEQELNDRGENLVELTPPTPPPLQPINQQLLSEGIRAPGPVTIGVSPQQAPTSDCRIIINNLLPALQFSLAPLGFLFCILNVIMKLIDCVNAVPKCILQLSPAPILVALEGLLKAVLCLAGLMPQLSMLYMLYDILNLIVKLLECLISALQSIKAILTQMNEAFAAAGDDSYLKAQLTAAIAQVNSQSGQTMIIANPLVPIFTMIAMFLPLFGVPQEKIDAITSFSCPAQGTPIDTVLPIFQTLHDVLAEIKEILRILIGG